MKLTVGKTIRLTLFIIIGIGIFGYAIYTIGKQSNLFGNTFTIKGIFNDVSGLKIGNNARFSGINVGTVSEIKILNDSLVQVDITVEQKVQKFIRKDSKLEIGTEGLMGNKVINIIPGSSTAPVVKEGETLQTIEAIKIDQIMEELKKSSENTTVVTQNLAEITDKINKGEGIFGKLFTDTTFTNNLDRISYNTAKMTRTLNQITTKINQEQGVLGKLLSDTALAKQFDQAGENLLTSTKNLEEFTSKINQGEGVFGKMYTDTTFTNNIEDIAKNINYTTNKAKEISDKLLRVSEQVESGKGLINKLLTDSVFADSIQQTLHSIDKSAKEIEEASETVRKNWFIRTFSKKKKDDRKEQKMKEKEQNNKE
jgi:phospholipid/cholesterol/gamma-HCH transport system substrate-binding protein